jgi:hypothetical protein
MKPEENPEYGWRRITRVTTTATPCVDAMTQISLAFRLLYRLESASVKTTSNNVGPVKYF